MTQWRRVSRALVCPVCGRPDWCLISADGFAAICVRIQEGAVKRAGEGGYLHRIRDSDGWRERAQTAAVKSKPTPTVDMERLAERCERAIGDSRRQRLADYLGLSVESLRRLRCGWSEYHRAFTFPMVNAAGAVCGIRLRLPGGRKLSVKGGREGLFVPRRLPAAGQLLITEGPTDAAALLDFGFAAVGRPSCTGGTQLLTEVCKGRDVAIVADADEPGQRGAAALAAALRLYCPSVRIIAPPDGVKDARAWKLAGATAADVQVAIEAAAVMRLGKATVRR